MRGRRLFFVWHSWIGLTAGLLLFVVCWSGTLAVFSQELDWLADPRLRSAHSDAPMAWRAVQERALAAKPGWTITQINAPRAPGFSAEVLMEDPHGVRGRLYADPATGEVLGATSYFNVQRFFRSLHMSLFIENWPVWGIPLGYFTVGLLSFVLLASLTTSLLFYRRFWRGLFRLERNKGGKVFWSDLHKLTGLWGLWFIALIGITGVWYLVEWKVTSVAPVPKPPVAAGATFTALPLDTVVERAERAHPQLDIRTVGFWYRSAGMLEMNGQDGAMLVRDRAARVWVDIRDGRVLAVQRASELSPLHRWIDTADPLHFGNFGGLGSKIVWFVFGLGLSGLCLTGAYLQAKRQARHPPPTVRAAVLWAYGTTVAILSLATWRGYAEIARYGQGGELANTPGLVVTILGVWVASTVGVLTFWMLKLR